MRRRKSRPEHGNNNARPEFEAAESPLKLLKTMLYSDDCPRDLRDASDILLKGTKDESKPGFYVSIDPKLKEVFSRHYLELLSKKSNKFPKARYYCSLCNYHNDTIVASINHILQNRHSNLERMKNIEFTILNIPKVQPEHSTYMSELLSKISQSHGLSSSDMKKRQDIIDRLNKAASDVDLDVKFAIFGSSLSGFGFKSSNVNINIGLPSNNTATPNSAPYESSILLTKVFKTLQAQSFCSNLTELINNKISTIEFVDTKTNLNCIIHLNNFSGVQTSRLLLEYSKLNEKIKTLVLSFRYWAQLVELDRQDYGSFPPHCFVIMVLHFLQKRGLIPIINFDPDNPVEITPWSDDSKIQLEIDDPVGKLWVELFKYYSNEFQYKEEVVSMSHSDVKKNDKVWNRKLSIEDPVLSKSNLSRSTSNNRICDYTIDRIKLAYLYFAIPRTKLCPLYEAIIEDELFDKRKGFIFQLEFVLPTNNLRVYNRKIDESPDNNVNTFKIESTDSSVLIINIKDNNGKEKPIVALRDSHFLHSVLQKDEYFYTFDKDILQFGIAPPIICKSCGQENHLKQNCPEETLPPLQPVSEPSIFTHNMLNNAIYASYKNGTLNQEDITIRMNILEEIKRVLWKKLQNIELNLFGSTHNGFGLNNSDLDICLTFINSSGPSNSQSVDKIEFFQNRIVECLKKSGIMTDIVAIPSAKVPIIKFRHKASLLEGDISLSNNLALENTKLLRIYSMIDERAKILGSFLKRLTKLCEISDASKGSLSSYSYVLMLIHYLQACPNPVLPVLQEMHTSKYKPVEKIDGWNVWFFNEIENVEKYWKGYGKNKLSCSQLWLGFLRYYTEQFDFEKHVITISQSKPLNRAEKFWNTEAISIEDPFETSHNLGSGLSRRMSVHILRSFQKFREFYHVSIDKIKIKDWNGYFMEKHRVYGGNPPIDRQCRICGRIGHFARNCTFERGVDSISDDQDSKVENTLETKKNIKYDKKVLEDANKFNTIKLSNSEMRNEKSNVDEIELELKSLDLEFFDRDSMCAEEQEEFKKLIAQKRVTFEIKNKPWEKVEDKDKEIVEDKNELEGINTGKNISEFESDKSSDPGSSYYPTISQPVFHYPFIEFGYFPRPLHIPPPGFAPIGGPPPPPSVPSFAPRHYAPIMYPPPPPQSHFQNDLLSNNSMMNGTFMHPSQPQYMGFDPRRMMGPPHTMLRYSAPPFPFSHNPYMMNSRMQGHNNGMIVDNSGNIYTSASHDALENTRCTQSLKIAVVVPTLDNRAYNHPNSSYSSPQNSQNYRSASS